MGGLRVSPQYYDDDEDEGSDVTCEFCDETFDYDQEAVLIRLGYTFPCRGSPVAMAAITEEGEYEADPFCVCFECWEEQTSMIKGLVKDTPTPKNPSGSPLRCSCCRSPITVGEYCLLETLGEISASPRTGESVFNGEQVTDVLCMDCVTVINDEIGNLIWPDRWEEDEDEEEEGV